MPFLKRLGFYLAGLSIGLVFLAFFLKKKSDETGVSFCYLPNCRVLKDLRSKSLSFSTQLQDQIDRKLIDTTGMSKVFKDGEVIFKMSDPRAEPCGSYHLEGIMNKREVSIDLTSCKDKVQIEALNFR